MTVTFRQSPNYTGNMGPKSVIVIHWWGNPADKPSLSGTVNWLCNPAAQVSAHYVVSGTTVYQLVREEHVAWHARDANPFSIGIEVDPNTPPGTYETVIQLCRDIAQRHQMNRSSCIKRHKDYVNTQCPGTLDIERIRQGVLNQPAQGGANDVTDEQNFQNCFITVAQRWASKEEVDAWRKSGLPPYTWVQQHAPNNLFNHHQALEIYQQAREKAGSHYEGGPAQFATDRLQGGDTFHTVMERDLAHYLVRERQASELDKENTRIRADFDRKLTDMQVQLNDMDEVNQILAKQANEAKATIKSKVEESNALKDQVRELKSQLAEAQNAPHVPGGPIEDYSAVELLRMALNKFLKGTSK